RRPGAVLVVLRGDGADLLGGEVVRKLAQRLLLVGQGEVDHCLLLARRLTGQSICVRAKITPAAGRVNRYPSRFRIRARMQGCRTPSASSSWWSSSSGRSGRSSRWGGSGAPTTRSAAAASPWATAPTGRRASRPPRWRPA